jgi:CRP-like cAMP-binding protein
VAACNGPPQYGERERNLDATELDIKSGHKAKKMADLTIQPETRLERLAAVAAHPLAELLDCPHDAGSLLASASRTIDYDPGQVVFRQHSASRGLYVVVSGEFARKAERFQMRVTLGTARPGDLLELAAALGDGHHTYTLNAVTPGSMLLLPIESLHRAFQSYPPLRMRLLEELAREVSRAYITCCLSRIAPARRQPRSC